MTKAEMGILLERARRVNMSPAEREEQRRSFAYGNANIENEAVTRAVINEVAEQMAKDPTLEDLISDDSRDGRRRQ